uniref:Metalloendopeptidase n=1 Tax=Magallana gigas TaxID=29159 RepID=K1PBI1_MAGGI
MKLVFLFCIVSTMVGLGESFHKFDERDFENDAEKQSVDTRNGTFRPKNIHPELKKYLLNQKYDNHIWNFQKGRPPPEEKNNNTISKRNFAEDFPFLWPNGVIPYVVDYASFDSSDASRLSNLINWAVEIIHNSSCVTWKLRENEQEYVRIFNGEDCSSIIGKVSGSTSGQKLSLNSANCLFLETVIHEMLHAMGGEHEQTRGDRNRHLKFNWENIEENAVHNNILRPTKNDAPYDLSSIMQYGLKDFSKNNKKTMELINPDLEYLLTEGGKTLTIYDIEEINDAYQCTASCTNVCKNGGVVKKSNSVCSCSCPPGLKGPDCSQLDTSQGCGGFLNLSEGQFSALSQINYVTGLTCTWLVKGTPGTRIKAKVLTMGLPYSSQFDCYHWIEFKDNLIGQSGKEKCGDVGGAEFVKSLYGDPSMMMIRFNSAKHSDKTPGLGFYVTVEAYRSADSTNVCTLDNDLYTCAFKQDRTDSQFQWAISSKFSASTNNNQALILFPLEYGSFFYGWKSMLTTSARFEEGMVVARLVTWSPSGHLVHFSDQCNNREFSLVGLHIYEGDGLAKTNALMLTKENATKAWVDQEVTIPSVNNLKLTIEGTIGRQKVVLDDIAIKPRGCGESVPCVDFNPCKNGAQCVPSGSLATCSCNSCRFGGMYCEIDLAFSCTFENSNCFLDDVRYDEFNWRVQQGITSSYNTGPNSAYQGSYYAYIEASAPRVSGDRAILRSNQIFQDQVYCFKMKYHMYSGYFNHMGSLRIMTKTGTRRPVTQWEVSGNQGLFWRSMQISLKLDSKTKILVEGVVGNGWAGDIAIDNVRLTGCAC